MKNLLQVKGIFYLLAFVFIFSFQGNAQTFSFPKNGDKRGFNLEKSRGNKTRLSYKTRDFKLVDAYVDGENMKQFEYGAMSLLPRPKGLPNIPAESKYIAVKKGADVKLKVISAKKKVYNNILIAPAAAVPMDNEDEIPAERGVQYSRNELYPLEPFTVEKTEIRGLTLAQVTLNPFQYNAVTKELVVYTDIEVELQTSNTRSYYVEDRYRSKYWDDILADFVINYDQLPPLPEQRTIKAGEKGCDYLILVPNVSYIKQWADTIRVFRNEQGIKTDIVCIDDIGGNDFDKIDDFFEKVAAEYNPVPSGVLLMSDYGTTSKYITAKEYKHPTKETYFTDNDYADVTGNALPDFAFARMTGRNAFQYQVMVKKFINYESNPPMEESFYKKPVTALGWQTERWFQLCSEVVGGYLKKKQNKTPIRINAIYEGDPTVDPWSTGNSPDNVVDFFGPKGLGYIPATPNELGGFSGGNASQIADAINAGSYMVIHRDHGFESGWGEPSFYTRDVNDLKNGDKLPHVFSINCLTGRYTNSAVCMAEAFHFKSDGGAVSITAASQISFSFYNDAYFWGMFDCFNPDFMPNYGTSAKWTKDFRPCFGNVAGKYFLSNSSWVSYWNKSITYRLFHHFGDAFGTIYSEVPQDLSVNFADKIKESESSITITADKGSLIGLSVKGELLAAATATGDPMEITFDAQEAGTEIKVVVTKQNYKRYSGKFIVYAENKGLVKCTQVKIDESEGNENGYYEAGETLFLNIKLTNVGNIDSEKVNVKLSSTLEGLEILDGEETFDAIAAFESANKEKALKIRIPKGLNDGTKVPLTINSTNGSNSWNQEVSFSIVAPKPSVETYTFEEAGTEKDGYFNASEDVTLTVKLNNISKCDLSKGLAEVNYKEKDLTFDVAALEVPELKAKKTTKISFPVKIGDKIKAGDIIEVPFAYKADGYIYEETFLIPIGSLKEDFETRNTDTYVWGSEGDVTWKLVDNGGYNGKYCMKSGKISDKQVSAMTLTFNCLSDSKISFSVKTSSEQGFDYCRFYIDGRKKKSFSGETEWEDVSFTLRKGEHTLMWEYKKDPQEGAGEDCAWIDNIVLPYSNCMYLNAGKGSKASKDMPSIALYPIAKNCDNVEWSTNGDGSFVKTSEANTSYNIGSNDIKKGSVELTLTGTKGEISRSSKVTYMIVEGVYLEETDNSAIQIVPNPANSYIEILNNSSDNLNKYQIINNLGQVIIEGDIAGQSDYINTSNIPDGVYLLKTMGNTAENTNKIVIKH
ncbi:MAG: C25 family cysteine peptidase [Bacteroidales bacterium]